MTPHIPKPSHLSPAYASQFKDGAVAQAYRHRPPYPDELFPKLAGLIGDGPRRVLDLGTGSGFVARGLAEFVERVDAVDFSRPLLEVARSLPKGDHPNIRWVWAAAEDAPLDPPYGLVTAGSSLHWMDWYAVLPRVGAALENGCYLALFDQQANPLPWDDALRQIIPSYSTNRDFRACTLVDELTSRHLFRTVGRFRTGTMVFAQSINDHVESMHGRNGFSRDRMSPAAAAEFDRAMRSVMEPHCPRGIVTMDVFTEVVFGIPTP